MRHWLRGRLRPPCRLGVPLGKRDVLYVPSAGRDEVSGPQLRNGTHMVSGKALADGFRGLTGG